MPSRRACVNGWPRSTAPCGGWTRAPTGVPCAALCRYRTSAWRPTPLQSSPSRRRGPSPAASRGGGCYVPAMAGKVAIVTGGGTGIGRASALALGRDGYSVVIAGRRPGPLDQTVSDGAAEGSRLLAVTADVSDPGDVRRLFDQAQRHFGRVDVLFNNARRGLPPVPLADASIADWQSGVSANLTAAFLCTQDASPVIQDDDTR